MREPRQSGGLNRPAFPPLEIQTSKMLRDERMAAMRRPQRGLGTTGERQDWAGRDGPADRAETGSSLQLRSS